MLSPALIATDLGVLIVQTKDHFDLDLSRLYPSGAPFPLPGGLPTRLADLGFLEASVGLSGPVLSRSCTQLNHSTIQTLPSPDTSAISIPAAWQRLDIRWATRSVSE